MEINFSIWLASKTRWVHLVKAIEMPVVPRVDEYMKFDNPEVGGYIPWKVTEVTYRESGEIEVSTELLDNIEDRGYSFDLEEEFDEYYQSYLRSGWYSKRGVGENKRVKKHNAAN